MDNIAYIYQPHFMTEMFRVATKDQMGEVDNFIVVTCSPEYNGVYCYPASNTKNYEIWYNNKTPCFCVPIKDCIKLKELKSLENPELIKHIKSQQNAWYKNNIRNREYDYKKKPEWML